MSCSQAVTIRRVEGHKNEVHEVNVYIIVRRVLLTTQCGVPAVNISAVLQLLSVPYRLDRSITASLSRRGPGRSVSSVAGGHSGVGSPRNGQYEMTLMVMEIHTIIPKPATSRLDGVITLKVAADTTYSRHIQ